MKHILANKTKLLFAAGCALAILTTGCIREDLDACPSHKLTVKVVNTKGEDVTEAGTDVMEAAVFIFDKSYNHLSTHKLTQADVAGRRKIELNYPEGQKLYAIAWGNAYMGNQNVTEGAIIEQLKVALKAQNEIANHPDELFYGNKDITTKAIETEVVDTVTIKIKVGQIILGTENLPAAIRKAQQLKGLKADEVDHCDLYVERTLSVYNHDGVLEGDSVYYMPVGAFDESGEWWTDNKNLAAGEKLRTAIDVGNGLVSQERLVDIDNQPITIPEGGAKEVLFQWDGEGNFIGVKVTVRPWGYVHDTHEF